MTTLAPAAPAPRLNLMDKLNNGVQTVKQDMHDIMEKTEGYRDKINTALRTICESITEASQALAERSQDTIVTSTSYEIPEFDTPTASAEAYGILPFVRYMPVSKGELNALSLSPETIDELSRLIRMATTSLERYNKHLNDEQIILTPVLKTALNIYGVGTACKTILSAAPVQHIFCVENHAYSCLKGMSVISKMPNKDFKERNDSFLVELKAAPTKWSADYIKFWEQITPALAAQYLNKYFSILSTETVEVIRSVLWEELRLIAVIRASLNPDGKLFDQVTGYEEAFLNSIADGFLGKNFLDMIQEARFNTFSGSDTKSNTDIYGIQHLLGLKKGAGFELNYDETELDALLACGFKIDEAEYLISKDKPPSVDHKPQTFIDSINTTNTTLSAIERAGAQKRKSSEDSLVPTKRANQLITAQNVLPAFTKQVMADSIRLDNLIGPFGAILKQFGAFSINSDFKFSSRDYMPFDVPAENINEYFGNLTDFYTMWVHLSHIFEPAHIKAFDAFLVPLFEEMVKSLRVSAICLNLSTNAKNGVTTPLENSAESPESTLLSYMDKYAKEIFPLNVSFREATFIGQYLAYRNKSSTKFSNLCITCVLDDFLLTPHVQLVLLYCMGAFIKFLELRVRGGVSSFDADLLRIFSNEDQLLHQNHHLLLIILAQNLILDKLFRVAYLSTMRTTSTMTSDMVRLELQRYGRITDIENVREFKKHLPELVAASRAFENGLNVNIIKTSVSYLQAFSQLKNVAMLVCGTIDPRTYMNSCASPIYEINKSIAYAMYIVNKDRVKMQNGDDDDDVNYDDGIKTACGSSKVNEVENILKRERGCLSSLNDLLTKIAPKGSYYKLGTVEPYTVPMDMGTHVFPLSFLQDADLPAAHIPNFFTKKTNHIFGDTHAGSRTKNKYLFISADEEISPDSLPSEFNLTPVAVMPPHLDDEDTSLYYVTRRPPAMNTKKCVRHGSDLCLVNNHASFSWLQSIIDSMSVGPRSRIVCVIKSGDDVKLPLHKKHGVMAPIGREPHTYVLNVERGEPDMETDLNWRSALYDFNGNGDVLAVPASDDWRGGALDIDKFPGDVMAVLNNYRQESVERQVEMDAKFYANMISTTEQLKANLDKVNTFTAMPLSDILSSLSSDIKNDSIVEMPLTNYAVAKAHINNMIGPLGQHLADLEPILYDVEKEILNEKKPNDAEHVIKMRHNFAELYRSMLQIKKVLPEVIEKHYNHAVFMTNILNQLESCVFFALLPLWVIIHVTTYPYLYILDEVQRVKVTYLEEFVDFQNGGGLYVNIANFITYVDTKHETVYQRKEYLARFIYFLRTLIEKGNQYVYMFQSCSVLKTPMIPFYIGATCVFIAHALENHATLN